MKAGEEGVGVGGGGGGKLVIEGVLSTFTNSLETRNFRFLFELYEGGKGKRGRY